MLTDCFETFAVWYSMFVRPEMFTLEWCEMVYRRGGASSSTGLPDPGRDSIQYRGQSKISMRLKMFLANDFYAAFYYIVSPGLEDQYSDTLYGIWFRHGLLYGSACPPQKFRPNKGLDLKQHTHNYRKILKQVTFKMQRCLLHCCLLWDIFSLDPGSQRDT